MQEPTTLMTATDPIVKNLTWDNQFLIIEWVSGYTSRFPFIFLLDNAPGSRHQNGQKLIETSALDTQSQPGNVTLSGRDNISIEWEGNEQEILYPIQWLLENDLSGMRFMQLKNEQSGKYAAGLWDHQLNRQLPIGEFSKICADEDALADWLNYTRIYGFALLKNVPPEDGAIMDVIELFGYPRETNYGRLFDVRTVTHPGNLAYTPMGISAHTDNPYRDPTPTLQLLHCLQSNTKGGDSILVDGFKVAEDLRDKYPKYFKLLSSVMVTFRFNDENNFLEHTTPIISLLPDLSIRCIKFNNRSVQPFHLLPDDLLAFYEAYIHFARMLEDYRYQVRFRMEPGDLYIVDNERVLHARTAFDDRDGQRWIQGAYADRDGLLSKWRILEQKRS